MFYIVDGDVLCAAIRGDLEINEIKLRNYLKAKEADQREKSTRKDLDAAKAARQAARQAQKAELKAARKAARIAQKAEIKAARKEAKKAQKDHLKGVL